MSKELSGAAGDVLHALFFHGALVDGDLPSKAGAAELRELGYVMTQNTVTPFAGENYYNFLTPAGQEFAIRYLVEDWKTDSDPRQMESLTDTASACDNIRVVNKRLFGINPFSTAIVKLSYEMREAVIAAVRDSGQFVEKPTGDVQQSVVFMADRFKVTVEVNDSGEPTIQQQIQQAANAVIEATKAALARQDAAMADLASSQAAITESINKAVNDAIANALRPGGVLYAFRTRT